MGPERLQFWRIWPEIQRQNYTRKDKSGGLRLIFLFSSESFDYLPPQLSKIFFLSHPPPFPISASSEHEGSDQRHRRHHRDEVCASESRCEAGGLHPGIRQQHVLQTVHPAAWERTTVRDGDGYGDTCGLKDTAYAFQRSFRRFSVFLRNFLERLKV